MWSKQSLVGVNPTRLDCCLRSDENTNIDVYKRQFEGIAALSKMYYDWTDAKTPDIPGDGKMFFTADSWFNVAQAGMKQLGSSLIEGETLNLSGETYAHIFATTYVPAVEGGIAIYLSLIHISTA